MGMGMGMGRKGMEGREGGREGGRVEADGK